MVTSDLSPSSHELTAIKTGNHSVFADVLSRWMPDILSIAGTFASNSFDRDDYVQIGSLTLHQVCVNYTDDVGKVFVRYTRRALRLAMIDMARSDRRKGRKAVTSVSPTDLPEQEVPWLGPVESLLLKEREALVRSWWNGIMGRSRTLLDRIYGSGASQVEVALELGLTAARINQLHRELISEARRALALLN